LRYVKSNVKKARLKDAERVISRNPLYLKPEVEAVSSALGVRRGAR
jgi:hypothetical protein